MNKSEVMTIALECGIALSTGHGQGDDKLCPISDTATLVQFAKRIRQQSNKELRSEYAELLKMATAQAKTIRDYQMKQKSE